MGNGSWSWSGEDVLLHQLNGTSTILTNGVIDVSFLPRSPLWCECLAL